MKKVTYVSWPGRDSAGWRGAASFPRILPEQREFQNQPQIMQTTKSNMAPPVKWRRRLTIKINETDVDGLDYILQ